MSNGGRDWTWRRSRAGVELIVGETKRCPRCSSLAGGHVYRPFGDFARDQNRPHGMAVYCRECAVAVKGKSLRKKEAAVASWATPAEVDRLWSSFVLGSGGCDVDT